MSAELLFEIGTEEIPAGFVTRALAELERLAVERLRDARLDATSVSALGTPRRMTLLVEGLAGRQTDLSERVVGPPARAAFDADGNPTKAAIGFAKKNGVEVSALERVEVPDKKGEYVACTRSEAGRSTLEVLPPLLEQLVHDLPWSKQMRWHWRDDAFARPVHWIVALYGGEVVGVSLHGIQAGRFTRGHRFLAPQPIELEGDREGYVKALRRAFVIVDPDARRGSIEAELRRIEEEAGVRVRPDRALLDEVNFLVEYPVGVCGSFDERFLEVPEEVIVSAMRAHQRYFAVEDAQGRLANKFVTIAGTVTRDPEAVRQGNERVLAARLADARFFFDEDRKKSLDEWGRALDGVVFQAKLGSIGAKVARVAKLGARIAPAEAADTVARAAALCKADLVTHMVGEFPDLQGVMGAHYARLAGEPAAVCDAIVEHYQPKGAGDAPPASDAGAALSIADKLDTMTGCFAVGLAPTGSADPYALRRAALGTLTILLDRGWSLRLDELVAAADDGHEVEVPRADVLEFLRVRLRGLLVDGRSLPADCVDAALAAGFADVQDAAARAEAVAKLRERADFEPLASAFKRIANILKGEAAGGEVDVARFDHDSERELWDAFGKVRDRVDGCLGSGDYAGALAVLAELKGPVDKFFDDVLVMDKDEQVRNNRLSLLSTINAQFTRIADFRQLAV